ncbi:MAG: helix-turn-helix transcriptional regulator [Verrucomicrobia bacterium]|nr:helix-turn-helix transcriptional regulator [Verrucomicrobiota bacterium]
MMPTLHQPDDPAGPLTPTRQRTGDGVQFGGLRVSVHQLPAGRETQAPDGGLNHFWLIYEAPQAEAGRMATESTGVGSDLRLFFVAPGVLCHAAIRGHYERPVTRFELQPAFLEAAALSLRIDPRVLYHTEKQEVLLDGPLETLCGLVAQEAEEGCPHGLGFFEALSCALAVALVRRVAPARAARPRDLRVERAVQLLEQRFRERVSTAEAARVAGLSRCHFLRAFRASVGVSPHEYLVQCRLRHARRLIALDGGQRSLAEIAVEAGFSDQAHLTRRFRRAFGQTPGHWQRSQ